MGKLLSRVARRWLRLILPSNLSLESSKSVTSVYIVIKSCSILLSRPVDIGKYRPGFNSVRRVNPPEISNMFL